MENFKIEGDFQGNAAKINFTLVIMQFVDENNIHFLYSPHLDLTGYGTTAEEAGESFNEALGEFLDYTTKKRTLGKVLVGLGWQLKGKVKNPKKLNAPSMSEVMKRNNYVSEVFDKYPVHTYRQNVGMPTAAFA